MADIPAAAAALAGSGRGILAADESAATMNLRLQRAGVAAGPEQRRAYREMLATTPHLAEGVSGVILSAETFGQRTHSGSSFPQLLAGRGLLAGVRADTGAAPLPGRTGERVTEGLDGLVRRLAALAADGARFAKWRAVYQVGDGRPSWQAVHANSHLLARFAAGCVEAGLVPVLEPAVAMDGGQSAARCSAATSAVLLGLTGELDNFGVAADRVVLVLRMIAGGAGHGQAVRPEEVADRTTGALAGLVPASIGGIAFGSGALGPELATASLAALLRAALLLAELPWPLTFCFGSAVTGPALAAWRGRAGLTGHGQRALANRVACNLAALRGGYRAADAACYALG